MACVFMLMAHNVYGCLKGESSGKYTYLMCNVIMIPIPIVQIPILRRVCDRVCVFYPSFNDNIAT